MVSNGERGDTGERGVSGERGPKGDHGQHGEKGKTGPRGQAATISWKMFVYGYALPMVLFFAALAVGYVKFDRRDSESILQRVQLCETAKTNARVNFAQNVRLASLLDASIESRRQRGTHTNGFEKAVEKAITKMLVENESLSEASNRDCRP